MKDLDKIRQAIIQLQHDGHNSLDRVMERIRIQSEFNRIATRWETENNVKIPNLTHSYITNEYMKTHTEVMRNVLEQMYQITKELKLK